MRLKPSDLQKPIDTKLTQTADIVYQVLRERHKRELTAARLEFRRDLFRALRLKLRLKVGRPRLKVLTSIERGLKKGFTLPAAIQASDQKFTTLPNPCEASPSKPRSAKERRQH